MTEPAPERRYVPLAERGFAPPRTERLVVDGQFATVVGVERAYLVRLEDGRYVALSQDAYREAAAMARAEAEAVRGRAGSHVIPGTVVRTSE